MSHTGSGCPQTALEVWAQGRDGWTAWRESQSGLRHPGEVLCPGHGPGVSSRVGPHFSELGAVRDEEQERRRGGGGEEELGSQGGGHPAGRTPSHERSDRW